MLLSVLPRCLIQDLPSPRVVTDVFSLRVAMEGVCVFQTDSREVPVATCTFEVRVRLLRHLSHAPTRRERSFIRPLLHIGFVKLYLRCFYYDF